MPGCPFLQATKVDDRKALAAVQNKGPDDPIWAALYDKLIELAGTEQTAAAIKAHRPIPGRGERGGDAFPKG